MRCRRKFLGFAVAAVAALGFSSCSRTTSGEEVAVLSTKFGDIVIRFREDAAPQHVANFRKLAREGFYDGTTFHRVIPGFMI